MPTSSSPRAVYFQHERHEDLGALGPALEQEGFTLVKRFRSVQREDLDAELVIALGGAMGLDEADAHPYLVQEQSILGERLALERPCLGICLGAQLLAAAGGAEVSRGKNGLEVGVAPVRWTPAGQQDEVTAGLTDRTPFAHWHQDTWAPVPGAVHLASTARYTQQAFRLGPSYGFQFHPEVTAQAFGQWLDQGAADLAKAGKKLDELKAPLGKLRAAEPALGDLLARLAHHYAKVIR
jgi:GMP synthase (glutamine-hydrolysing)